MLFKIVALLSGFLFGLGMMISGMVNPVKVIGFLDVFGQWDPSLAFVMGSALMVFLPGYFLFIRKQTKPKFAMSFSVSQNQQVDKKLLSGSLIFGIGWGVVGICPGPAITALGSGSGMIILFFASMLIGMYLVNMFTEKKAKLSYQVQG
ncbi:YeeE/YedE family protein [Grimontia kaedaensis]|uniref:YeeE/YedE family protein n=1 Tax=Grimontia kaedaensis TaxID=2872157 RepID=A0ABY4X1J3_9GAMM|nr:YeeE/YedE family protein [Grimontia kaedaensis]USH05083.1 YeeE/YedE family protein [Grimontia kaedaensis]